MYSSPSKEIHLDTSSESNLHCYDQEKLPQCNCCEMLFLTRIMSCIVIFGIKDELSANTCPFVHTCLIKWQKKNLIFAGNTL